jgi:hypothetical protein
LGTTLSNESFIDKVAQQYAGEVIGESEKSAFNQLNINKMLMDQIH